jgi:hypothetical protein
MNVLPPELTQLLGQWTGGDGRALDELMPLVYEELRRIGIWRRNARVTPCKLLRWSMKFISSSRTGDPQKRSKHRRCGAIKPGE